MKKLLTASAIALALIAGPLVNSAKAGDNCTTVCGVWGVAPYAVAGGLVAFGIYLIANKDAPAGSLKAAAPDENMQQFQANAKGYTPAPAYAFVNSSAVVASATK